MTTQTKSPELRFIPITRPGVVGFNFKHARTDAQEAAVRKKAAERGLLAGRARRLGFGRDPERPLRRRVLLFARWRRGAATVGHATKRKAPTLASQGAEANARPVDLREARLARRKSLVGMRPGQERMHSVLVARTPVDHQDCGGVRGTGGSVANFLIGEVGTNFDDWLW